MSQISKTIFSALAVFSLAAVPLAFGEDLAERWQAVSDTTATIATVTSINRAGKADREVGATATAAPTRTIALRLENLTDTSVLVRIPFEKDAGNGPATTLRKSGDRRTAVACEPPVSVLTDVARLIQPGRCVT